MSSAAEPIREVLLATRNQGKLRELRELLGPLGVEVVGLERFPAAPEVEETGATFAENAAKKARELAAATGMWTLADDSGLEVDALEGAPGVYSARYSGTEGDSRDAANNAKLLSSMATVAEREARFRCAIALCTPSGELRYAGEGTCEGVIAEHLAGSGGFGYDPLFLPRAGGRVKAPLEGRSMAELSSAEKNAISHRGQAVRAFAAWLAERRDD